MKKILLSLCLLGLMAPVSAHAEGKRFFDMWWPSSHWKNQDFKPYYQDGQEPHNTQWSKENWQSGDWVALDGNGGEALIHKFYQTRIIKDQYVDGGIPYLDVDVNFYHLSGFDKGRAMATVDNVYRVTDKKPGMFYLKDGTTDKVIGYYTAAAGLILE